MTTKRSKSSERWLARQRKDPFTKKAATEGRVSRAHYKLEPVAIIGKSVGDIGVVETPNGQVEYEVASVALLC